MLRPSTHGPNSGAGRVEAGRKGYDGSVLRRRLILPPEERAELRQSTRSLGGRLALGGLAALGVAVPFTLLALLVLGKWQPLARASTCASRTT